MSLTTEQVRDPGEGLEPQAPPPAEAQPERHVCAQCGSELAPDQEWCLECGAARTIVHHPPDWRIPVAIVGGVIALVLAAFAIALINLSNGANRSAQAVPAQAATSSPQPAASGTTTAPAPAQPLAAVGGWPSGVSGWTVELANRHRRRRAFNVARLFLGAGIKAGVLNSSRHPLMTPGLWVVFYGRYPDEAAAAAAAARLRAEGHRRAQPVEVAAPGGI